MDFLEVQQARRARQARAPCNVLKSSRLRPQQGAWMAPRRRSPFDQETNEALSIRWCQPLRQLAAERFDSGLNVVGTSDEVAERMGEVIEAIGGDGLFISTPFQRISCRSSMRSARGWS